MCGSGIDGKAGTDTGLATATATDTAVAQQFAAPPRIQHAGIMVYPANNQPLARSI